MIFNHLTFSLPFFHNGVSFSNGFCLVKKNLQTLQNLSALILDFHEKVFFQALKHPQTQLNYLLGRYCAKKSIENYGLKVSPQEISIKSGVWGQPIIISTKISNLQISIAHSKECGVALAFPEGYPMGIDVEKIDSNNAETIRTIISPHTLNLLKGIYPETEDVILLTMLWTLQESLSKALKCGLTVPFHILEADNFIEQNMRISCSFPFFPQYTGISYVLNEYVVGITYPKQLSLEDSS